MASEEKMKALDAALAQIEKQYGKGSVMKLGDQSANMGIDVVPTGSLSLDLALGLGGMPRGRIIEIYGQNQVVRQPLHCMWLLKYRRWVVLQALLMQSMHSTQRMQRI